MNGDKIAEQDEDVMNESLDAIDGKIRLLEQMLKEKTADADGPGRQDGAIFMNQGLQDIKREPNERQRGAASRDGFGGEEQLKESMVKLDPKYAPNTKGNDKQKAKKYRKNAATKPPVEKQPETDIPDQDEMEEVPRYRLNQHEREDMNLEVQTQYQKLHQELNLL